MAGGFTWNQLISGFTPKKESANYNVNNCTSIDLFLIL